MHHLDLDALVLAKGSHNSPESGMCVLEAVAFMANEPFSDRPRCVSPVIADFLRAWNDSMNDTDRQMLKPLIPRLIGTRRNQEVERHRAYLMLNWVSRVSTPTWLRLIGLDAEAWAIEQTAPIMDPVSACAAKSVLQRAREKADPAHGAALDAAYGAALEAAYGAALEAAYGAAHGAALDAALDAAYGAAYGAALEAAYGAAYGAALEAVYGAPYEKLRPTVDALQRSALWLVDAMIASAERSEGEAAL